MPNHYHLVLRPLVDGEMSRFMAWVGGTHTMRYHAHYHTGGMGHVYQQRYKSFPIQDDDHFFVVCRSRRAKRPACGTGRPGRRLAVEFSVALASQARTPAAAVVPLAARAASRLGRACQHALVRGRTASGAAFGPAW
nr:transposase [Roseimaritima sediminicola]